jgi:spore coat polysaccharide biosynthesis protein SpsF
MADGQLDNIKVCFIIQARMNSTRLPGKVLMPIPITNGKPIIQWIVDELKKLKLSCKIIVASSTNYENDALENYCKENSINFFRGDENDVLSRFIKIAKMENPDVVVRLTGDNPIIDISLLQNVITHHVVNQNDYTTTEWLPIGMNMEVVSPAALISLENVETTYSEKEHVTLYFKNNDFFKKQVIKLVEDIEYSKLRLTIDYLSDYLVVSQLLAISQASEIFGFDLVKIVYEKYNWLFQVNKDNIQKKTPADLLEEFVMAVNTLEQNQLLNAALFLKNYNEKCLSAS